MHHTHGFLGYCWGAAGSQWLSRVLNAHPDILCIHTPKFPRIDGSDRRDVIDVLAHFFLSDEYAHPYVGFTHGVSIDWKEQIEERFTGLLTSFVLVRHPVPRVRSVIALYRAHSRVLGEAWKDETVASWMPILDEYHSVIPGSVRLDFRFLSFLYGCKMVTAIDQEQGTGYRIFRVEDLSSHSEALPDLIEHVGADPDLLPKETLDHVRALVVGSHAGSRRSPREIWRAWATNWKTVYDSVISESIVDGYEALGYDMEMNK